MNHKNKKMKGGSKASQLVMETANPKLCDDTNQVVNEGPPVAGDVKQLSLYRTTGGGRKRQSPKRRKTSSNRKSKRNNKRNRKRKSKRRSKRRGYRLRGGSTASNLVMASNPKLCNQSQMPVHQGNPFQAQPGNVNIYQTTGGGRNCYTNHHPGAVIGDCQNGGGSDWRSTVYSRGPVNVPTMHADQFRMFNQSSEVIPNESLRMAKFAGGARRRKNNKSKSKSKKSKGKKKINLLRSDRGPNRGHNLRGGGSDWRSTVYSRGPVNVPTMNEQQFRAFNQSSPYLANESLRMGAFV